MVPAAPIITLSGLTGNQTDAQDNRFGWSVVDPDFQPLTTVATLYRNGTAIEGRLANSGTFDFNHRGPGQYEIMVTAHDSSGAVTHSNVDGPYMTVVSDDDPIPPTLTIGGSSGTQDDGETQVFTWMVSDPSGVSFVSVDVRHNGVSVFTSSAVSGSFNFDSLGVGTFQIQVTARDADNDHPFDQIGLSGSRTMTVTDDDTNGPTTIIRNASGAEITDSAVSEGSGLTNAFHWEVGDASGLSIVRVTVYKDAVAVTSFAAGPSGSFNLDGLGLGVFDILVTATDNDVDWGPGDRLSRSVGGRITVINESPVTVDDSFSMGEDGVPELSVQGAVPSATVGAGTAVPTPDRIAFFHQVVLGTSLDGYTENGLRISVPDTAYLSSAPGPGFSGGWHYPFEGMNAPTSIRAADGAELYGIEFNTSNGWGPQTNFLHWWMYDDGALIGEGTLTSLKGEVSAFAYAGGFDELLVGAYGSLSEAQNAIVDDLQALAIDNVKAELTAPGVLANDTDAEGDALTAVLVSGPAHGDLSFNADGTFDYAPHANFNGSDSFTYKAFDGELFSDPSVVTIIVTPVNDAPQVFDNFHPVNEDDVLVLPAHLGALANAADDGGQTLDGDGDGTPDYLDAFPDDPLNAVSISASSLVSELVSGPNHGTLTLNPDGSFQYTPAANFHGLDSFTYRASDGLLFSNIGTFLIIVEPVNDAPSAEAGSDQVANEGGTVAFVGNGLTATAIHSRTPGTSGMALPRRERPRHMSTRTTGVMSSR